MASGQTESELALSRCGAGLALDDLRKTDRVGMLILHGMSDHQLISSKENCERVQAVRIELAHPATHR
jgi:hypothetical protein